MSLLWITTDSVVVIQILNYLKGTFNKADMVKTCPFIRKIWWYTFAVYLPFAVFLPTANPKNLPFADSKSKRQQNDMSTPKRLWTVNVCGFFS